MRLPKLSRKQKLIAAGGAGVVVLLLLLRHKASAAAAEQGLTGGEGGGLDTSWHGRPGVDAVASRYDDQGHLHEVKREGAYYVTYRDGVAVGYADPNRPGTVSAETAAHRYSTAELTSLMVDADGHTYWNPTQAQAQSLGLVAMPAFCASPRAAQVWCQSTLDAYCLPQPIGISSRSTARGCVATAVTSPTLIQRAKAAAEGRVVTLRGTRYAVR